jgi:hypothetical protein
MHARTILPLALLRHLYGTGPFVRYCRERRIDFDQAAGRAITRRAERRWLAAVRRLGEAAQARVDLELAQVSELSDPATLALLTEAARGRGLPPDAVPDGAARALWFFLHHPALFHDVLLQQEVAETGAWRVAQAPAGHRADDLFGRRDALADTLREFFRRQEGTGRYSAVDAFPLHDAACFVAYVSDRLHVLDVFTDDGTYTTRTARLAVPLVFAYEPASGRITLKTRLRSRDRILDLVQRFGRSVLGVELPPDCLRPTYRLDVLKRPFDPPPDAADMERVRVKALHLTYPERNGRRRVKLETLPGDGQHAIRDLLREHGGRGHTVDDCTVVYAELEVRLNVGGLRKPYVVRLWPDRSSLGQTPLGGRFHACLRRWGLTHAA